MKLTIADRRSFLAFPATETSLICAATLAHVVALIISANNGWSLIAPKLMVVSGTLFMAGYLLRDMALRQRSELEPQVITLIVICFLVGLIQYHATWDAVIWGFFTCQCFVVITLTWFTLFKRSW